MIIDGYTQCPRCRSRAAYCLSMGGWPSSHKFHWVVTESKEALRDDKLEELGI